MTDDSKPGGQSRLLAWTAFLAFTFCILYVLSVGPVLWLDEKTSLGHLSGTSQFLTIYEPLKWIYQHNGLFKNFMDAYLNLFGVR